VNITIEQAKNIKVAIGKMFAEPNARQFLEAMCHFRKPTWTGNTEASLIAEGQRQVYLTLLTIHEREPEELVLMYQEKGV